MRDAASNNDDVLSRIIAGKRQEVALLKSRYSSDDLRARATAQDSPRDFTAALADASRQGYGLIAEIKKASPSKGVIRADFDPAALARAYQQGGAACLSVLTDEQWFQGHMDYMVKAREAVGLPVLRKDFMIDPIQMLEARAFGADCVLLIMAALTDSQAAELEQAALALDMDVLIEIHDATELERAKLLQSPLLGVNNRNLKTMHTDLATGEDLLRSFPPERIAVAESGLASPDDLAQMARAGARCFLIGESLMRKADVATATRQLLAAPVAANTDDKGRGK